MIIGLCGNPNSGKTEVTKHLVNHHGFEILDTKKPLRDIASIITGLPSDDFKLSKVKNNHFYNGFKMREILGETGYFLEEMFGDDYLLMNALRSVENIESKNIVVDALRMDQGKSLPGYVVEIKNPKTFTEFSFDYYNREILDYTLNNDGTLDELKLAITKMVVDLSSRNKYFTAS